MWKQKSGFKWCVKKNAALTSTEKGNLPKKKSSRPPPPIMKWSLPKAPFRLLPHGNCLKEPCILFFEYQVVLRSQRTFLWGGVASRARQQSGQLRQNTNFLSEIFMLRLRKWRQDFRVLNNIAARGILYGEEVYFINLCRRARDQDRYNEKPWEPRTLNWTEQLS